MNNIFIYYISTITGYLSVYIIGHLISCLFLDVSTKSIYTELKKNLIGFIFVLTIYSIYKSHFHTINTGWIIIAILLLINKKIELKIYFFINNWKKINFSLVAWQLYILTIIFLHAFYLSKSLISETYYLPFANMYKDPYFYTCIINNLADKGIENHFYDAASIINYSNVSLYHFGELWYSAFFLSIFKLRPLYVFSVIAYPVYSTYAVISVLSLVYLIFKKLNTKMLIFSPLLLIVSGVSFFYPAFSFLDSTNLDLGLFSYPKYSILLIFITIQLIFIYKENYFLWIMSLFATLIINTGIIAPLGLSACCFITILYFKRKITFLEITSYIVFTTLFLFLTIGLILLLNNKPAVSVVNDTIIDIKDFISITYIVTLSKFIIAYSLKFTLSFIVPFILLVISIISIKNKHSIIKNNLFLLLYIVILFFCGIMTSGIFVKMTDSFQFRNNIYTPLISCVVFILFQYLISSNNLINMIMAVFLIGLSLYQTKPYLRIPSEFNYKFTKEVLNSYKGGNVAFFINKNKKYINIVSYFPMEYLLHFTNKFYPICINVFDIKIPKDNEYETKAISLAIASTSFYEFNNYSKHLNPTKSQKEIELDFLKTYDFKYFVYDDKNIIPLEIQNKFKKTYFNTRDSIYFSVIN